MTFTTYYLDQETKTVHAFASDAPFQDRLTPMRVDDGNKRHKAEKMTELWRWHTSCVAPNCFDSSNLNGMTLRKSEMTHIEMVECAEKGPGRSKLTTKQEHALDDFRYRLESGQELTCGQISYLGTIFDISLERGSYA